MRSTPSFAPPGGVRGAGAGLLLLLPCWMRSMPSFAPPGGVRGAGAGLRLLRNILDNMLWGNPIWVIDLYVCLNVRV